MAQDDSGDSSSGGERTSYQEKRKIPESVDLGDLAPDPDAGLTPDEAATVMEDVLDEFPDTNLEGYAREDLEGDEQALREAAERLRAEGSIEAATEALERLDELDRLEAGEGAEGEAIETDGEPIPFEAIADRLGVSADDVLVTRKIQGEEEAVPLSEALADHMKYAAFTKKTQQLAETRKELKGALEGTQARLEALGAVFGKALTPQQRQQVSAAYERTLAEKAALEAHHLENNVLPQEHEALKEKLGWETPEDAQAGKQRLAEAAISQGFEAADLEGVHDHRLLVLLDKAARYDEMQEQMEDAKGTARSKRRKSKTLEPGVGGSQKRKPKKASNARKRLARFGRIDDAAAALDEFLPDDVI